MGPTKSEDKQDILVWYGGELFTFTFISLFGENISPRYSILWEPTKNKRYIVYLKSFDNC
jgi:hypothetical protein